MVANRLKDIHIFVVVILLCLSVSIAAVIAEDSLAAVYDEQPPPIPPNLDPALRIDMPYEKIRPALLKNGWKPVIATDRNIYGEMTSRVGVPGILYKAGFKEVYFCGATGYCLFNFVKNGKCLRISTLGDYVKGKLPRIYTWWEECYKPE